MMDLRHAALETLGAQPYYIGDDWSVVVYFEDGAGAVDLTGMSFRSTVKDVEGTTLLSLDSADSSEIEILNQTTNTGKIRLYIKRTDTVAEGSRHLIDIVRVEADSSEQTWALGFFEARARVTPTPLP